MDSSCSFLSTWGAISLEKQENSHIYKETQGEQASSAFIILGPTCAFYSLQASSNSYLFSNSTPKLIIIL